MEKKPLNYYGFAFNELGEGYTKDFLRSAKGKKSIKKEKQNRKKYAKQRSKRGFDDTELWSLDETIANFVYPRLKRFKKHLNGHPGNLTIEQWEEILNKMTKSFELVLNDEITEETYDEYTEGMNLFAEYFINLWD